MHNYNYTLCIYIQSFVARWYANVLQVHTRLEVELDHGRGGAKSRAGCPTSESSGAKVLVQPTVTAMCVIARLAFAVKVPFITGN